MKQLMNLSQVHEEVRNRIRADASRRITKIDRRLKRFSEDLLPNTLGDSPCRGK